MNREIEVKFRLADPADLRQLLVKCGAERLDFVHEINHILDTPKRRLLSAGRGLRIRTWRSLDDAERHGAILTFKGPRAAGEFKSRTEYETELLDADTALAILDRIGFHEVIRYEKRRETWRLGDCEVVLDELPRLGWFVEIEGPTTDAIQSVRQRLNLADTPVVAETYVHLTARHGEVDDIGRICLTSDSPAWQDRPR
ncbi:MAG: class IV adenylate cyclase [Planctomycetota bacterium]